MATARKPRLRSVSPDEKPAPKKLNVAQAAESGNHRSLLVAMRDRIAEAVADPECPKRELASLTLRLHNIVKEIKALESAEGKDDLGSAVNTPDAKFDPTAI